MHEKNVEIVDIILVRAPNVLSPVFNTHTDASRSRQELSNEYLVAKIGVDIAENEPSKV